MCKKLYVLVVVVGLVGHADVVDLLDALGLVGVDLLQNAEPTKVWERELELLQGLVPGDVPGCHEDVPPPPSADALPSQVPEPAMLLDCDREEHTELLASLGMSLAQVGRRKLLLS